jgi:hypothetical protein
MVISNTSAEDIKTHAVSPEFILNTSFEYLFISFIRQGECQSRIFSLVVEINDYLPENKKQPLEHFRIKQIKD